MRFLFWGINYAPETTGIAPYTTEWAEWLAARGHEVEVVSTFPYYPEWKKRPEHCGRFRGTEELNGVRVHRCWHYVPSDPVPLRRIVHEASFVAASADLILSRRPDLLVVVLPPLLLAAAARVLGGLGRVPYWVHVQDLQPDAAVSLGMLKPSAFTRLLYGTEAFGYRGALAVSSIAPGMLDRLRTKPSAAGKVCSLPNWTRGTETPAPARARVEAFRKSLGASDSDVVFSYSGNLGAKQGLASVLEAVRRVGPEVPARWVFVGNGVEAGALQRKVESLGLRHVTCLPLLESGVYREMLAASDACLVPQRPGSGEFFFPSKLLSLWQAGRPVFAVADPGGTLDREVREAGGGWSVPAGNADALADQVRHICSLRTSEREAKGQAGRAWVALRYDRDTLLAEWLATAKAKLAGLGAIPPSFR